MSIFGKDFPTEDETAARDYIHVVDLAKGHISAIGALSSGVKVYNLGTGRPTTVLQLVNAYQRACGKDIPYEFVARREGDAEILLACPDKAENELNWRA